MGAEYTERFTGSLHRYKNTEYTAAKTKPALVLLQCCMFLFSGLNIVINMVFSVLN